MTPDQERHRHECEVRETVRLWNHNGKNWMIEHIKLLEKHRGREAAEKVLADAAKLRKGMR